MFNPYAQGGWANAANPNAASSISAASSPTFMAFRFALNPTILDSAVTGPQSRTYFRVGTDSPTVGFTVVHNLANQPMIIIEWARHPIIEIRDIVSKRQISHWLPLSADKSYRTMTANGKAFFWGLTDSTSACLYSSGVGAPQTHARVFRDRAEVVLEITAEAVQIGLLEICVAVALLLKCGRNID
ncbi:hypothetical protein B0H17DRAFT_1209689 [Mycena rosella]|uniref:Uncharacterized protein n=1 Tax=Mycena rosella TaxID=1033263 RepID=A0AAD7G886_MYCRO|nr:hypothetical protein B0H17DRAFT_1209689 [Mycena rosella]